ncbi:MAG: multidrug effflux MFS transporter [Proteobacteria bacterium]|nr:multidrug effflux MFS transporter [Pseudomonadota bacterium]
MSLAPPTRSMPYRLALLVALMSMSIDIHFPALSTMVDAFHSTHQALQLTISSLCVGLFLAGFIIGPMADAYGRRRVLHVCLLGFAITSFGCAWAPTLDTLLLFRFLQGVFAAGAPIIVMAILFDWYTHEEFARMGSLIGMVITFSLALAPVIGGHLSAAFGWRSIFWFLLGACVLLSAISLPFLPETLKEKKPFHLKQVLASYADIFSSWQVIGHLLLPSILIGFIVGYVSLASYYFIDVLRVPKDHYGYFQACGTLGNVLFCLFASHWTARFGAHKVLKGGVLMAGLSGLFFLFMALFAPHDPYLLTMPVFFLAAGIAMVFSPAMSLAMRSFGREAATVSATFAAVRMGLLGVCAYFAGIIYNESVTSLAALFVTGSILTLIVYVLLQGATLQPTAPSTAHDQT